MHLLHELSVVGSMCLPKGFKYYQAVSTSKKTILEERIEIAALFSEMDLDNVDTKKV